MVDEKEDIKKLGFMTFKLGKEYYGVDIKLVKEIVAIQKITEIPKVQPYIKGLINLRGKVVPVLDVRIRLGIDERQYDDRTCIIIVNVDSVEVGLIVDTISEVVNFSQNDILDPTELGQNVQSEKFVKSIGKVDDEVKLLLDCKYLIGA